MVGAVEDLRYSFLLIVGRVPQKLGPAVFTKDPIKVWVVSVDFDNNHIVGLVDVINITKRQHSRAMWSTGANDAQSYHKLAYRQTYTGFMKNSEEGVLVYATRNPTGKVLSVLLEFHVAVAIACIRVDYRKVFWLVIAWRQGGDTFGHGGGRQRPTHGGRVGFVVGFA